MSTLYFGPHIIISPRIVFYRTALSFAFVNRKQVVPGHVLVSPVRRAQRFNELTPDEVSDLFLVAQRVSSVMMTHHSARSMTLAIQDGPDSGQTIPHVHIHVLPRKPGDFNSNDDVYKHLESHDKKVVEWRIESDMIHEAETLKEYF